MIYHTEAQSLSWFCSYLQCFDDAETDDNGQYRNNRTLKELGFDDIQIIDIA